MFAADRTGRRDYALASAGGAVIFHSALSPYTTGGPTGRSQQIIVDHVAMP